MTQARPPAIGAHPLLKFIYQELKIQEMSLATLSAKSGVSYNTLKEAMQNRCNISLRSTEAALNTLGFTMKPTALHWTKKPSTKRRGRPKE